MIEKTLMMKRYTTILIAFLTVLTTVQLQAQKKYDYGADSANCVQNLSLFNEFIKQKAYKEAYRSWTTLVDICPASRKGLYTSGVKMMRDLIGDEQDEARKAALIDTMAYLFDKRIENFGQEGYVLGRKGVELFRYSSDENVCEVKDIMKQSMDLQKQNAEAVVISNYYNALYKCYRQDGVELETMFTEYLELSDVINFNIEKYTAEFAKDTTDSKTEQRLGNYVKAKNNLDEFFIKFADCDDIVEIFQNRITESPDDLELKKKALRVMNRKECTDSDLFLSVAKEVHEAEPSFESAYAIAQKEALNKNFSVALRYYDEADEYCGECAEKTNILKKIGLLAANQGNRSKANAAANAMAKRERDNGWPYYIKGLALMRSSGSCDDGKLGKFAAFWAAEDLFIRAKSVDDSEALVNAANKAIASCRAQYPAKQDVFFYGVSDGQSYTLPCTGGSTTVRTK